MKDVWSQQVEYRNIPEMQRYGPQSGAVTLPALPGGISWQGGDIALAVLAALCGIIVMTLAAGLGLGIAALATGTEIDRTILGIALALSVDISLLGSVWWFAVARRKATLGALGFRRMTRAAPKWLIPAAVVGCLGIAISYGVVVDALDPPQFFKSDGLFEDGMANWAVALFAALAIVAAPVVEETFFRGFVFSGLRRRLGFRGAAGLSALIFALAHLEPVTFLPIFAIGVALAWVYSETDSLAAPMLVHAAYNGTVVAIGLATR